MLQRNSVTLELGDQFSLLTNYNNNNNSSPKYLMFITYPKGIQDVGDFVSSVEETDTPN